MAERVLMIEDDDLVAAMRREYLGARAGGTCFEVKLRGADSGG